MRFSARSTISMPSSIAMRSMNCPVLPWRRELENNAMTPLIASVSPERSELLQGCSLLFRGVAFVIAIDQRANDADFQLRRGGRQRALHLVECEHDLEPVLELRLRYQGGAREPLADARVATGRVSRRQIAGRARFGLRPRVDNVG